MIKQRFLKLSKNAQCWIVLFCILCCVIGCSSASLSVTQNDFVVHYIDVGQGDCSLISCGGKYMLIDSGEEEESKNVLEYLKELRIKELEYVVNTHPHSDHIGGMHKILSEIDVNTIIMPDICNEITEYNKMVDVINKRKITTIVACTGNVYSLGGSIFTILAPNSDEYENINDYSVVIKFDYQDTSFLFTGDCENISEYEMVASGYDLGSDVLKVAHHGSSTSTCESFLKAVNPTIAVISAGENNQYGHPHASVMSLLDRYNVECFCTKDCGTIIIISDGTGYSVIKEKEISRACACYKIRV